MTNITLYQFAPDEGVESGSPFCVKAHRLLAFKGLDYAVQNVGTPGELKRINPEASKVPVIDVDGTLVADSTRIAHFLEERHADPPLLPDDPGQAANCRLIEDWADESLYWFAVWIRWGHDGNFDAFRRRFFDRTLSIPLKWIVPRVARKQAQKQLRFQGLGRADDATILAMLDQHLQTLEDMLGASTYLVGDQPTLADIAVFGPLRQLAVGVMAESAQMIASRERLVTYLKDVDRQTTGEHTVAV
jgi:glutathione S-transferase